ncbi:MAG: hypothetical protein ACYT04_34450 [Nostoc sp.]
MDERSSEVDERVFDMDERSSEVDERVFDMDERSSEVDERVFDFPCPLVPLSSHPPLLFGYAHGKPTPHSLPN